MNSEEGVSPSEAMATAIEAARDSLTEDNWHKGSYFTAKRGIVCMCAHGALQAKVNRRVAKALSLRWASAEDAAVAASAAEAAEAALAAEVAATAEDVADVEAASAAEEAAAAAPSRAVGVVFSNRPKWVSEPKVGLDAHYVLGMAGLFASYNDDPKTTLSDVKEKFTQAAAIARSLGDVALPGTGAQ